MERIRLSPSVFKITRPGYDVSSAVNLNLAFDGFAGKYNGAYLVGMAAFDGSWVESIIGNPFTGGGVFVRKAKEIYFGKVFSQPPQIIYSVRPTGNPIYGGRPRYSALKYETSGAGPFGVVVAAATAVNKAVLSIDYVWSTANDGTGGYGLNWEISYVVFQT